MPEEERRRRSDGRGEPERARRLGVDFDLADETSGLDDDELVRRADDADAQALLELFRRYQDLTWRVARATTLSDDEAVTAVAEVFGHLSRVRSSPLPSSASLPSFRAALAAATRDAALECMRRRRTVRHPLTGGLVGWPRDRDARTEGEVGEDPLDLRDEDPSDLDMIDLTETAGTLAVALPSPPAELWAIVRVAWSDRVSKSGKPEEIGPSA